MTVYVDDFAGQAEHLLGGRARWFHLTADTKDELHKFAESLGLRREWFQDDEPFWHYDCVTRVRREAISFGAKPVTTRELVKIALRREGRDELAEAMG